MSTFDDFAVGQRVAHIRLGDGDVIDVTPDHVHVRYFDSFRTVGSYDRRWFELHPRYLFGRSDPVSPTTPPRAEGEAT